MKLAVSCLLIDDNIQTAQSAGNVLAVNMQNTAVRHITFRVTVHRLTCRITVKTTGEGLRGHNEIKRRIILKKLPRHIMTGIHSIAFRHIGIDDSSGSRLITAADRRLITGHKRTHRDRVIKRIEQLIIVKTELCQHSIDALNAVFLSKTLRKKDGVIHRITTDSRKRADSRSNTTTRKQIARAHHITVRRRILSVRHMITHQACFLQLLIIRRNNQMTAVLSALLKNGAVRKTAIQTHRRIDARNGL